MIDPKISVIVPVYNVEKYIKKCLDSLFKQTYKNLEIIIINDASTDNSLEIIKNCIKNKNNVKLINNEENKGQSVSRNVGIEFSTGDYIGFIDSDDYVDTNFYEALINTIIKDDADICVCDINVVEESKGYINRVICGSYSNKKIDFINNGLAASSCNKLFKKSIINSKYPVGKINEDVSFIIPIIINAKKISYTKECVYYYVQRNSSTQNSDFSEKRFDIFYVVDSTLKNIENVDDYEIYKNIIICEQIFKFFLFGITKEKSIIKRFKYLKRFYKLSKRYQLSKNPYIFEFINEQSKKQKYYYKCIFFFSSHGFSLITTFLISLYNLYKKIFTKKVLPNSIDIKTLINLAKKQSKLKLQNITVSVVVPNYNYEQFLYQRLYSILYQTEKIKEIILLDDCSVDNSRKVIDELINELEPYIDIKKVYNKKNSGSVFKQWEKGFNIATGDYVWIAEADDFCDKNLLKTLIKPCKKYSNISISYSDTAFIYANGYIFMKTVKPQIDIRKTGHWAHSYINEGIDEIENYSYLNCTIANVSSCIIKNKNYKDYFEMSSNFKQAGDWLFYVNVISNGKIAYSSRILNYYRVHGANVSSVMDKENHIKEIQKIYEYFLSKFNIKLEKQENMKKRIEFLKHIWGLSR